MIQIPLHRHNGSDSPQLFGGDILGAPQSALTTLQSGAFSTGGANDLKTADAEKLENMRTVLSELITKLQNLGFIQ